MFICLNLNRIKLSLLIIRAGALGDTLMLMPLIHALKKRHVVTVMGRQPGISYLEPFVAKCIDMERGGWHRLFVGDSKRGLKLPDADHVTAFVADSDNTVSENLRNLLPESRVNIFPPFPDHESRIHVALYMACALQAIGIPLDCHSAFNEALKKPLMQTYRIPCKSIVLHPGSGSKGKNYSPDFWFDLLSEIKREGFSREMDICFLLGPAEENIEAAIGKTAEEHGVKMINRPEKKELLSILNSACLYIGHDNGITHIAAMLGVNTIALFKSSSVDQWRPLGPSVKIIGPDMDTDLILKTIIRECKGLL